MKTYFLMLFLIPAWPAKEIYLDHWALPLDVYYDGVEDDLFEQAHPMLGPALELLESAPPQGKHFFDWQGDRSGLRGKKVRLVILDSGKSQAGDILGDIGKRTATHGVYIDALPDGQTRLTILIFLDRVLFHNGQPIAFQFFHYVASLAEDLFGGVQRYLESAHGQRPELTHAVGLEAMRGFVSRVVQSPRLEQLDARTRQGFMQAHKNLVKLKAEMESCDRHLAPAVDLWPRRRNRKSQ